jgi:hypothetical protein
MKTQAISINRIALLLVFGLLMITTYAQDKKQSKNCHENLPTHVSQPQPPAGVNEPGAPPVPPMPPDPPEREGFRDHRPILDLPDLTDDQKTAIKKVDLAFMPQVTPLRKLVDADKARLEALLAMHPADMTQTDNVADEIGKTVSKLLKIMIQYDQSLRATLSPDQQIIFDARPKPWLHMRP